MKSQRKCVKSEVLQAEEMFIMGRCEYQGMVHELQRRILKHRKEQYLETYETFTMDNAWKGKLNGCTTTMPT